MFLLLAGSALALDRIATVRVGVGIPDMVGGSVSLTAIRPLEVEVGGATGFVYQTAFVRAGGVLPLHRGDTVLVEGLALAGYRYLAPGSLAKHGVELDVAGELTWWLAPHFGLEAQLLVGGGAWIAPAAEPLGVFLDGRFAVGVAF